jgi:rhodanese-related sulfurtransferase
MKPSIVLAAVSLSVVLLVADGLAGCGKCGPCGDKEEAVKQGCGNREGVCKETDGGKKAACKEACAGKEEACEAKCGHKQARKSCRKASKSEAGCCGAGAKQAKTGYQTVDTDGLKKLIESDQSVVLVDARSGKYDDGRRIASASQLASSASDEEIASALPDKRAKIVAYCTNLKCPASAKLANRLVELGYTDVVKYPDGIDAWQAAGNDVNESKEN